jgi:hypothetical protein
MRVKNVLILALVPALILLFVILLNSCQDSNPIKTSGGTDLQLLARGFFNYPLTDTKIRINDVYYTPNSEGWVFPKNVNYPYDIYYIDTVRRYQILYKDVKTAGGIMNINLPASQSVDYNIAVHYPTLPPEQQGKLYFVDDTKDIMGVQDITQSSNIFFTAPAGLNLSGRIILITYIKDVNGHINDYKYFAEKQSVTVTPGTTEVTFVQTDLKTVDKYTVNCTINPPQGSSYIYAPYMLNFNNNKRVSGFATFLTLETFTTNNFTITLPKNLPTSGYTPTILIVTDGTNGDSRESSFLPLTAVNAEITIPSAPIIISPPDNAANVDTNTVFSIGKNATSNVLAFTLNDSVDNKHYVLYTTESNIKLSMLSSMVQLTPNRRYTYYVEQVGLGGCYDVGQYLSQGTNIPYFMGTSQGRSFTTKP